MSEPQLLAVDSAGNIVVGQSRQEIVFIDEATDGERYGAAVQIRQRLRRRRDAHRHGHVPPQRRAGIRPHFLRPVGYDAGDPG